MIRDTETSIHFLVDIISTMTEVQSIGISGGKTPPPEAGEGDIDVFIYCDTITDINKRQEIIRQWDDLLQDSKINVFEEGHWGTADFTLINGIETWLMYFSINETLDEIESILNGEYPDKLDNYYYPVGRCAMLQNINIFYDKNGFLGSLKKRLSEYPHKLAEKLIHYHLDELDDIEDLERAVMKKDILFYHFALDLAIDHFLQALFALNKTYFPSRKRTLDFIENFKLKPQKCSERLMDIIRLGGYPEGINQSYKVWSEIVAELKKIPSL